MILEVIVAVLAVLIGIVIVLYMRNKRIAAAQEGQRAREAARARQNAARQTPRADLSKTSFHPHPDATPGCAPSPAKSFSPPPLHPSGEGTGANAPAHGDGSANGGR